MNRHLLSATLGVTGMVLAMAAGPVEAATNLNSSKSNIYRAVAGAWDDGACLKAGGTIGEQGGIELCFLPVAAATNLNSSKSNIYRAIGGAGDEASCLDAGGIVVILDGKKRCYSTAASTQ